MQVFMPYTSIFKSVECLDNKRLGKQRIEIKYMLEVIYGMHPYRKHPIIEMWWDYPRYLSVIYAQTRLEWITRGNKNTLPKYMDFVVNDTSLTNDMPPWLEDYTYQYQALLLHKNYEHYSQIFGTKIEPIEKIPYLTREEIKEIYG